MQPYFLRNFQKIGENSSHLWVFLHVAPHFRTGLSSSAHRWWRKPYLSADQEAGCYCQAMCKVINGVGQQIEVSANLQRKGKAPDKGRDITRQKKAHGLDTGYTESWSDGKDQDMVLLQNFWWRSETLSVLKYKLNVMFSFTVNYVLG